MEPLFGTSPTGAFSVTVHPDDGRTGVRQVDVSGDLDLASRGRLVSTVAACLDQDPSTVALDLSQVAFMDSAGATGLLACCSRALARHARLAIIEPSAAVTRLVPPDMITALGIPVLMPAGRSAERESHAAV